MERTGVAVETVAECVHALKLPDLAQASVTIIAVLLFPSSSVADSHTCSTITYLLQYEPEACTVHRLNDILTRRDCLQLAANLSHVTVNRSVFHDAAIRVKTIHQRVA